MPRTGSGVRNPLGPNALRPTAAESRSAGRPPRRFPGAAPSTMFRMKRLGTAMVLLAAAQAARAEWINFTGGKAPDFPVKQWFNKAEGKSLTDFRGKAVLLEFWATW